MGKLIVSKSMSLDGFVAGPGVGASAPMGRGGLDLHAWFLDAGDDRDTQARLRQDAESIGAVILGRRTFDVGVDIWNDTPYPVPSFVLTHRPSRKRNMRSASFSFVSEGLESALALAKAAAGSLDVRLMGADVSRQYLEAGLVDELHLALVPILLGAGSRVFSERMQLELGDPAVVAGRGVTHLRYSLGRTAPAAADPQGRGAASAGKGR